MAEGFANHYGKDVMTATSAGLAPTQTVAQETIDTMGDKNIDISGHFPKKFDPLEAKGTDLIVNMSGFVLPGKPTAPVEEWKVRDPYGDSLEVYWESANDIEMKVMGLILRLRRESQGK
jgi:arsenate reductase (thioredoxin)